MASLLLRYRRTKHNRQQPVLVFHYGVQIIPRAPSDPLIQILPQSTTHNSPVGNEAHSPLSQLSICTLCLPPALFSTGPSPLAACESHSAALHSVTDAPQVK